MQGENTDAGGREKCRVRTPMAGKMQGANTNANSNGPKWQRMNMDYASALCAVSVLLLLFSLVLVFAPSSCVSVLLLLFCCCWCSHHCVRSLPRSLARCVFPLAYSMNGRSECVFHYPTIRSCTQMKVLVNAQQPRQQ